MTRTPADMHKRTRRGAYGGDTRRTRSHGPAAPAGKLPPTRHRGTGKVTPTPVPNWKLKKWAAVDEYAKPAGPAGGEGVAGLDEQSIRQMMDVVLPAECPATVTSVVPDLVCEPTDERTAMECDDPPVQEPVVEGEGKGEGEGEGEGPAGVAAADEMCGVVAAAPPACTALAEPASSTPCTWLTVYKPSANGGGFEVDYRVAVADEDEDDAGDETGVPTAAPSTATPTAPSTATPTAPPTAPSTVADVAERETSPEPEGTVRCVTFYVDDTDEEEDLVVPPQSPSDRRSSAPLSPAPYTQHPPSAPPSPHAYVVVDSDSDSEFEAYETETESGVTDDTWEPDNNSEGEGEGECDSD